MALNFIEKYKKEKLSKSLKTVVDGPIQYDLYQKDTGSIFNKQFEWVATCIDRKNPIIDLVMKDEIDGIPVRLSDTCFIDCKNLVSVAHFPSSTTITMHHLTLQGSGVRELPKDFQIRDSILIELRNLHNYEELIRQRGLEESKFGPFSEFAYCSQAKKRLESEKASFETLPPYVAYRKTEFVYNFQPIEIIAGQLPNGEWKAIVDGKLSTSTGTRYHNQDYLRNRYGVRALDYASFMSHKFDQSVVNAQEIKFTNLSKEEGIAEILRIYDATIGLTEQKMQECQTNDEKITAEFRQQCDEAQKGVDFTPRKIETSIEEPPKEEHQNEEIL